MLYGTLSDNQVEISSASNAPLAVFSRANGEYLHCDWLGTCGKPMSIMIYVGLARLSHLSTAVLVLAGGRAVRSTAPKDNCKIQGAKGVQFSMFLMILISDLRCFLVFIVSKCCCFNSKIWSFNSALRGRSAVTSDYSCPFDTSSLELVGVGVPPRHCSFRFA